MVLLFSYSARSVRRTYFQSSSAGFREVKGVARGSTAAQCFWKQAGWVEGGAGTRPGSGWSGREGVNSPLPWSPGSEWPSRGGSWGAQQEGACPKPGVLPGSLSIWLCPVDRNPEAPQGTSRPPLQVVSDGALLSRGCAEWGWGARASWPLPVMGI